MTAYYRSSTNATDKPNHVLLLGFKIGFQRILSEIGERHQAPGFSQPR
jgi:hypothetical protein